MTEIFIPQGTMLVSLCEDKETTTYYYYKISGNVLESYNNDSGDWEIETVVTLTYLLTNFKFHLIAKLPEYENYPNFKGYLNIKPTAHIFEELYQSPNEAEGTKHDTGKVRYSLLPKGVIEKVLSVLEFGAKKYSVDNWQKVPDARNRYYDAAMRHLQAWYYGETKDPETGESHLAHALCCLMFLLWLDNN